NDLPTKLRDSSGAFAGRLIPMPMTRSFFGKEDLSLKDGIKHEGPGLILFALMGYHEVYRGERPGLFPSAPAAPYLTQIEETSSPLTAYLRERCEIYQAAVDTAVAQGRALPKPEEYRVQPEVLTQDYSGWAQSNGLRPLAKNTLGSLLPAHVTGFRIE